MNITHFKHAFILNNQTDQDVEIVKRRFPDQKEIFVKSQSKKPIYFSNREGNDNKDHYINLNLKGFKTSDDICVSKPSLIHFFVKKDGNKTKKVQGMDIEEYKSFSLEVSLDYATNILTLREDTHNGTFNIVNKLNDMTIFIAQAEGKLAHNLADQYVEPLSSQPYSWPRAFTQSKTLNVCFVHKKTKEKSNISVIEYLDLTRGYKNDFNGNVFRFFHTRKIEGSCATLIFSYILDEADKNEDVLSVMNVKIPTFGISFIGGNPENRRELLYLHLAEIDVKKEVTQKFTKMDAKIRFFNIDNNTEVNSFYPIMLTPEFSHENLKIKNLNHFDVVYETINFDKEDKANENMTVYKNIDVKLVSSYIRVEESFINAIMATLTQMNLEKEVMTSYIEDNKLKHTYLKPSFDANKMKENLILIAEDNWRKDTNKVLASAFVNKIRISNHDVVFSLKREPDNSKAALNAYNNYLNSIGLNMLFSIKDLAINFKKFKLEEDFYPLPTVKQEIINQYKDNGISSGISNLADLDILGNPKTFFKEIQKGVDDLIDKPIETHGDQRNVGGVGKGILKGTGSFARHTAVGTFGAFGSISRTVADATAVLTLDHDYQRQRNKIKSENTQKTMHQLNKGVDSFNFAMKDSVAGVFRKPFEHTNKDGLAGAFKGAFIGIGGLFAKPITGLFDLVSSTSNGIRDMAKQETDLQSAGRVRMPRAFYEKKNYFKKFNNQDAMIFNMIEDQTNNRNNLIKYYQVVDKKVGKHNLLINTAD